ncbi:uncharacterized protein [Ptychodera flava]|uniref:uncharacterized protein isoform X3 n=1 Tax=Ptychodera flava TaxID=63121 RepID=UPI00396A1F6A
MDKDLKSPGLIRSGYVRQIVQKTNAVEENNNNTEKKPYIPKKRKQFRGQSDFDSSSPKSIDFYKRVKDLQEKEIESQNMLSTHQPEVLGPHISEYRGGHVQMRLKKDPPQETYRPKSWHHRHEDPKQEPAVVKNQHHEHYARMKTFSPPGTSSSSFNPEHRSWKDRNYSSSSRLDIMRSTTSLVNFNEEAKPQSKRGLVKQRTNAYDDMSHRALESAKFQRSEQGEPRNTQPMFQSLNLDKQRELYRQPHVRDFEKNNRNDLSEPNREQKWKAQPHVKEQTTEPLWAKHLERNDSFSRRVERMKDNKHIPVQRVPAQPQPQPQQYRVEETTNIGKGSSSHQVPSSNSDVQKSQSPAWRESETSLRPNSGPAETVKRSELTFMISSDGSQPKNSEPYLKDQYLSPKPAQEYARTPPSSTRREMSPPIPPQRDSSMKSFIKYHDKSPSWPVHTHGLNKPTIETQDSPVHAHAHTWSENTYARDKANMAAEVDSQEPLFVEGHRAQVRTLPVAKQPEEKTFVYQAHKEREPEKLRSDYSEEKSRTFYHPVHISPKGGYMIDGKHYQYPPSSKFELHTATVYRVEMEEPLHAEMPEPPTNSEPKFAKSYEYSEKYNIPSPPTRDIPLETQELKPELVNLDSPLPPRKRDLAKVSPERVRSPESLNSTIKSTGSTENMIQKYESFLRSNLEEQGYDSQVAEPLSTDLPKANYQRRFSREKVRDIAMKLEKDTQPCQNVVQTHLEQAPMMNGYQEETKQSPQGEHPESTLGKEKGSDDRWREDITHLDDEKASSIKRWWNSPCDYQVMPGMGTELSRKRSGMSPAEETAKRFETTLNEKGNLDDKTVSSDTNLSSDSRDELSKRLPSYSSRGDAPKPSSFTKSVEQPARHIGSRPSESGQSVTRYPESERKGISQEETYPDGVFYSQKDSHTQYSDKYRHGEPIDLLKMKEMREKERQRDREESLRKRTEAKSPVSPTNERVSILSHLQRENNQSKTVMATQK